jgi:pyruvate formate lyase activating enzyme
MLDWEGKIASSIFIGGCNFRCAFCHNPELVMRHKDIPPIGWTEIAGHLEDRRGWIDGVVIGGGEPTLSSEIEDLSREIKRLGFPVKLDTNGSEPAVLKRLIDNGLIDHIAMDVKTVFEKYPHVTQSNIDPGVIMKSVDLVAASGLDHEFRTTAYPPAAGKEDLIGIARHIGSRGGMDYVIQQFRPEIVLNEDALSHKPHSHDFLVSVVETCSDHIPTRIR